MAVQPDYMLVIHDFVARTEDELSFRRGQYIEVIEDDAAFNDKWYIGRNLATGSTGLFPSVFTTTVASLPPDIVAAPPADGDRVPTGAVDAMAVSSEKSVSRGTHNGLTAQSNDSAAAMINDIDAALHEMTQPSDSVASFVSDHHQPIVNEPISSVDRKKDASNGISSDSSTFRDGGSEHAAAVSGSGTSSNDSEIQTQYMDAKPNAAIFTGLNSLSGRPRPEDVVLWSPAQVQAYFEARGFDPTVARRFNDQSVTGRILLELDRDTLKELEISSFGQRFEIDKEIKWLQGNATTPSLGSPLGSPPEFQAMGTPQPMSPTPPNGSFSNGPGPHTPTIPSSTWPRFQSPASGPPAMLSAPVATALGSAASMNAPGTIAAPAPNVQPWTQPKQMRRPSTSIYGQRMIPKSSNPALNGAAVASAAAHHRRQSSATSRYSMQRYDWEGGLEPAVSEAGSIHSPGHSRSGSRASAIISGTPATSTQSDGGMPYKAGHARSLSDLGTVASTASPALSSDIKKHRRHSSVFSTFSTSSHSHRRFSGSVTASAAAMAAAAAAADNHNARDREAQLTPRSREPFQQSSPKKEKRNSGGAFKGLRTASSHVLRPQMMKQKTSAFQEGIQRTTAETAKQSAEFSGWMHKLSGTGPGMWKSRFFTLHGTRLSYFGTFKDTKERGLIDITGHRVIPIESGNEDKLVSLYARAAGGRYCFKLLPPQPGYRKGVAFTAPKTHYFAVESNQDLRNWTGALMRATIERDESKPALSTCATPVVSLAKAQELMNERLAREAAGGPPIPYPGSLDVSSVSSDSQPASSVQSAKIGQAAKKPSPNASTNGKSPGTTIISTGGNSVAASN